MSNEFFELSRLPCVFVFFIIYNKYISITSAYKYNVFCVSG